MKDTKADLMAFSALKTSYHTVRIPNQHKDRDSHARTLSLRASSETSSLNFRMQASAFWKAATPSSVSVKDTIAIA